MNLLVFFFLPKCVPDYLSVISLWIEYLWYLWKQHWKFSSHLCVSENRYFKQKLALFLTLFVPKPYRQKKNELEQEHGTGTFDHYCYVITIMVYCYKKKKLKCSFQLTVAAVWQNPFCAASLVISMTSVHFLAVSFSCGHFVRLT